MLMQREPETEHVGQPKTGLPLVGHHAQDRRTRDLPYIVIRSEDAAALLRMFFEENSLSTLPPVTQYLITGPGRLDRH